MSLEPAGSRRSVSPASSGRSSPVPRTPRRPIEDGLYKKDKNFRRYASGVERALSLFDTAQQEWADYISFLGRLLKAIQAHPKEINVVPHHTTIATRLAQCLNPLLPSGVHQKTLEVYEYIFSMIGRTGLSRDLHLYFPGLSSVLTFAALSVRAPFFSLLDRYIFTLDAPVLRPALKSIVLCLLPGLEDETSEDFERALQILDRSRDAVGSQGEKDNNYHDNAGDYYFWQCFFLASVTNPSRRQGALAFLVRKLPKLVVHPGHDSSIVKDEGFRNEGHREGLSAVAAAVITPEPGLLIRCFAAGLSDKQVLIQRGFLDLLVSHLPLSSPVLQKIVSSDDLERLVVAAAGVVASRDMSLNRRLWTWFLGPEITAADRDSQPNSPVEERKAILGDGVSSKRAEYFRCFGFQPLAQCVKRMLHQENSVAAERARPFRICLSLMDRWEVGSLLVPEIFIPAMNSAFSYSETATKDQLDEVLRSASIFLDGVESGLIWSGLARLVEGALTAGPTEQQRALRDLKLVKFILVTFNVREEDMITIHAPLLALLLSINLTELSVLQPPEVRDMSEKTSSLALSVLALLVQLIPERAFKTSASLGEGVPVQDRPTQPLQNDNVLARIHAFYSKNLGNLDATPPPLPSGDVDEILLRSAAHLLSHTLRNVTAHSEIETGTYILVSLIRRVEKSPVLLGTTLLATFREALKPTSTRGVGRPPSFPAIVSIVTVLTCLESVGIAEAYVSRVEVVQLLPLLCERIWSYLSPSIPKYHVEAVRCLWHLQAMTGQDRLIEASISTFLSARKLQDDAACMTSRVASARRFTILWTHTLQAQAPHADPGNKRLSRRNSIIPSMADHTTTGDFQAVLTRPLLLLLDALYEEDTELFVFVRDWLQNLPTLEQVLNLLISKPFRVESFPATQPASQSAMNTSTEQPGFAVDSLEPLYYLQHLYHVLRHPSNHTWMTLATETVRRTESHPQTIGSMSLQSFVAQSCMQILSSRPTTQEQHQWGPAMRRTALSVLQLILTNPYSAPLKQFELEIPLIECVRVALNDAETLLQPALLDATLAALKLRTTTELAPTPYLARQRTLSVNLSRLSFTEPIDEDAVPVASVTPPPQLVECLRIGFASTTSCFALEDWVNFLADVLPLFADNIFQNLIPLVECVCTRIRLVLEELKMTFRNLSFDKDIAPESTIISLMNALEHLLARAHDRLVSEEARSSQVKSPEQPSGFFGNMVSGVFTAETSHRRTATANSRLTVLLSFQDTIRICFSVWSWAGYSSDTSQQDSASLATFNYTSLRLRNRARRILEHLFAAETLECLETLVAIWCRSGNSVRGTDAPSVCGILHILDGSRPRNTIPAIFNAVYSRTNPTALDPIRMSSLTSNLADTELVAFLIAYTRSLEDDAMDEIWRDCVAFLKDVLANPLPYRQILPTLLDFTSMLAEKVDNTNFGEQRKMRRELGDLFMRLLTACFTMKPMGFLQDSSQSSATEKLSAGESTTREHPNRATDIVTVLASILPKLQLLLETNDRIMVAATSISTNIIGPTFRSKSFPENVTQAVLDLVFQLSRIANTSKSWKKDVGDAFNDPKFFAIPYKVVDDHWIPAIRQWIVSDKDRLLDVLSRLSAPTTASIMFGVGANAARLEADRKNQFNLRRAGVLILAADRDAFISNLSALEEKLVELIASTASSSPSSATRAEVFMVIRAMVLQISPVHLAPLWPVVNSELRTAVSSVLPGNPQCETYNNSSLVQACKLLDLLITVSPDDFQLHEWLFITDTIDAVYRPANWTPVALLDEVAEELGSIAPDYSPHAGQVSTTSHAVAGKRRPLLNISDVDGADIKAMAKNELVGSLLRPFFSQLSIYAYEATYGMGSPDLEACREDLLKDLFDGGTIVG